MQTILETDRLYLAIPSQLQIEQYYKDIIGTTMFDTIQWDGPSGVEDLISYWESNSSIDTSNHGSELHVALIEKSSDLYLGGAALRPVQNNPGYADVGYALAPKFHGKGYATEAMKALTDEAFKNRNAERIFAEVFAGNQTSRRVVEKLGFSYEGTFRRAILKKDQWLDKWILAITRPDWERINS